MRRTGSVSLFWNTFIYQIVLELFWPFWQIMRRVSSYFLVVIILFGFSVTACPSYEFLRTSSIILSLLVDARCSVGVTVSCDEDVGEVGEN